MKRAQVGSTCPVTTYTGTLSASLVYDPMGRLWQVVGATTNIRLLYDGEKLVAGYDSAGTMARRCFHSDNVDDPVVQYDGVAVGAVCSKVAIALPLDPPRRVTQLGNRPQQTASGMDIRGERAQLQLGKSVKLGQIDYRRIEGDA